MAQRMIEIENEFEDDEQQSFLPKTSSTATTSAGTNSTRNTRQMVSISAAFAFFVILWLYSFSKGVHHVEDIERKDPVNRASISSSIAVTDAVPNTAPPKKVPAMPTEVPTNIPQMVRESPSPVGVSTSAPTAPGFGKPRSYSSSSYIRRGKELTPDQQEEVDQQWGRWTFETRTNTLFPTGYPNQDVPRSAFPPGSWQTDPVYLKGFLESSLKYLERAREAMLQEYGHSEFDEPDKDFEARALLFNLTIAPNKRDKDSSNAGIVSYGTLLALRKRLLHAVVTESDFRFVMGGHSAAAGHGNHFQQSYTLQVQKVMEPILARLGVYFQAHNFGMGGMGTSQNALGAQDLYGRCDVLMWDSGMTEKDGASKDMFARMGLLSSQPVLWGRPDGGRYDVFGAGMIDTSSPSMLEIPITNFSNIDSIPYWARYLECDQEDMEICKGHRYDAHCWVDRDDGFLPPVKQQGKPGGQAGWHPGNRVHQFQGRVIAWQLVTQLYEGLKEWLEAPNYEIDDSTWHITADKERILEGVLNVTDSPCFHFNFDIPERLCQYPLRARSDMSPRRNPAQTSIMTIMKEGVKIPQPKPNLYDPPEQLNPSLFHPEIDIVHILQNGIDFQPNKARIEAIEEAASFQYERASITSQLEPGQGWGLNAKPNPDVCDGTWDSFCNRGATNCMLYGHNDHRGGITFDSLSGWMVLNLEKVKHGIVMVRMEYWLGKGHDPTSGWKCENNAESCAETRSRHRLLKPPYKFACDDFKIEFAIDGKVTTWDKEEWERQRQVVQRVVPLWVLLDDENWPEERDVELAIRQTGCGNLSEMQLSHVYWA